MAHESPEADSVKPVVIVAAMAEELAPLVARAQVGAPQRSGRCRVHRGFLSDRPVILASTGEGAFWARKGIAAILAGASAEALIVVGISGGLSPRLKSGNLVLAREVLRSGESLPVPDPRWLERAKHLGGASIGSVVSSGQILCSAEEKSELWGTLGREEVATVDLESATYAEVAAEHGVPYLIVRAVSDAAEEDLPIDFNRCLDAKGRIVRSKVLLRALRRPQGWIALRDLRGRLIQCSERLGTFLEELLRQEDG